MVANGKQNGGSEKMRGAMGLIGTTLGTFRVDELLGKGGMGIVYKAQDRALNRTVALKVLSPKLQDDEFIKRFIREARIAAALDHANIVQVYTISSADLQGTKVWYIAMQYIEGKTVAEYLQGGNRLSLRKALLVARYVADALRAAHTAGVVHRDIKPNNIMIDKSGKIKVMDFGLARSIVSSARVTQTGLFLGTPEYSSPEQCESGVIDGRSDIYSLGVVLYEMLSGRAPYAAETPYAIFRKIMDEPAPSLAKVNPSVPPQVVRLVEKMMAKKKEERYQGAEELLRDIDLLLKTDFAHQPSAGDESVDQLLAGQPEVSTPTPAPAKGSNGVHKRRHARPLARTKSHYSRWTKAAVWAAVLLVIGGIGYGLVAYNSGKDERKAQDVRKPEQSQAMLPARTEKIAIAVFDFINASQSVEAKWLEVGLSDMLIADLAQCGELQVASRRHLIDVMKEKAGKKIRMSEDERVHLTDEAKNVLSALKTDVVIHGSYYVQENREFRVIANVSRYDGGVLRDMNICKVDGKDYEKEMLARVDDLSLKIADVLRGVGGEFKLAGARDIKFSGGENVERLVMAQLAAPSDRGAGEPREKAKRDLESQDQRGRSAEEKSLASGGASEPVAKGDGAALAKKNEEDAKKEFGSLKAQEANAKAGADKPGDPAAASPPATPADTIQEAEKHADTSREKKQAELGEGAGAGENALSGEAIQSLRSYYQRLLDAESAGK